jgi:signal-transduction protein with cAMP-binding, CBS, and nucleotidyltransferase domain
MPYMNLRAFIEKYSRLDEQEWHTIEMFFEKKEFKKNEIILEEGQVCRYFYFLEKGLVRFYNTIDGEDMTKTLYHCPVLFYIEDQLPKASRIT